MSFLNPFRKDRRPPKAVEKVFEKMRVELEGRKLADEAISYRNLGEYEKALRLLMDAVQKYNYTPALTLVGTTALLKGDIDGAINWFEANIKDPPKGSSYLAIEWYANLGVIYLYKKEDCKKACVMCEKALSLSKPIEINDEQYNTTISAVHRDLAVAYLACGEISLALDFAFSTVQMSLRGGSCRSNLLFCGHFSSKKGLPRRQRARAAARNDINLRDVR